jgi:hypothetical protein
MAKPVVFVVTGQEQSAAGATRVAKRRSRGPRPARPHPAIRSRRRAARGGAECESPRSPARTSSCFTSRAARRCICARRTRSISFARKAGPPRPAAERRRKRKRSTARSEFRRGCSGGAWNALPLRAAAPTAGWAKSLLDGIDVIADGRRRSCRGRRRAQSGRASRRRRLPIATRRAAEAQGQRRASRGRRFRRRRRPALVARARHVREHGSHLRQAVEGPPGARRGDLRPLRQPSVRARSPHALRQSRSPMR